MASDRSGCGSAGPEEPLSPPAERPEPRPRESWLIEDRLASFENFVFFVMPMAYNMVFTASGGLIALLEKAYGARFWVWLNFCYYIVGFPVTYVQQRCDLAFDLRFGSLKTFRFRMLLALGLLTGCASALIADRTRPVLLGVMLLVGTLNAIAHGTACQLVQLFPPGSTVALQTGFRCPDVIALVLVIVLRLNGEPVGSWRIDVYYSVAALIVLVGAVAWGTLLLTRPVQAVLQTKDSMAATVQEEEAKHSLMDGEEHEPEPATPPTPAAAGGQIVLPRIALLLTIWSSCFLANFFSYVKSSGGTDISTVLYFTRLFSDLISRPTAKLGRPFFLRTQRRLLATACLRVALLAVFFLYITKILPQSDVFITCFVAIYAFMSGYLSVFSYQISQELSGPSPAERDTSSKLMNTAFQLGTFFSACSSILVSYTLH